MAGAIITRMYLLLLFNKTRHVFHIGLHVQPRHVGKKNFTRETPFDYI
jgi:hypothetical protein